VEQGFRFYIGIEELPFKEPSAEDATHLCDVHLFKDSCGPKSRADPWPGCLKPNRDLPKHVRQKIMLLYGRQYMTIAIRGHISHIKHAEYKDHLTCLAQRGLDMVQNMKQLLATTGLSTLHPNFAFLEKLKVIMSKFNSDRLVRDEGPD
jgi:hypothetical protein